MEAKDGRSGFDFAGTCTAIVPDERIEYAFGNRTARINFVDVSDSVTVTVIFDAESTHSIEQ